MRERLTRLEQARWFDLGLALVLLGLAALEVGVISPEPLNPLNDPHAPLAACASVVVCLAVAAWRRHALAAGGVVVAFELICALAGDLPYTAGTTLLAMYLLAYAVAVTGATRHATLAAAGMLAVLVGSSALTHGSWVPVAFVIAPWAVGRVLHSQREMVAQLERSTRELEAEQDAYARLSVRRERARIARELHDVVSHNLAVMVVQAGAGRVAPPGSADRDAGRFRNIRLAGEHGLEELSRLADMLEPQPGDDLAERRPLRLDVLIEHARAAGLTVHEPAAPLDAQLAPSVEQAAYRIVQEALTNAVKHAPDATIAVRVGVGAGVLELEVRDDGGCASTTSGLVASGSGTGLRGLGQRVSELGGELRAGPDDGGGWRVTARIPVDQPRT
jgi:signal transduction histidine kinase